MPIFIYFYSKKKKNDLGAIRKMAIVWRGAKHKNVFLIKYSAMRKIVFIDFNLYPHLKIILINAVYVRKKNYVNKCQ